LGQCWWSPESSGLFYKPEFTDDESLRDAAIGILDVNGWHNVGHIALAKPRSV